MIKKEITKGWYHELVNTIIKNTKNHTLFVLCFTTYNTYVTLNTTKVSRTINYTKI